MSSMLELFTKDPFDMTDGDIEEVVKIFREKRSAFLRNPSAVKAQKRTPAKPKATDTINLDLKL